MKIIIFALGSRGDVQPYVALGAGLRAAGHTVRLLASADFRELVTAQGLEFIAAAGLAAGVPSVVTPFFGDQPFWGQRVYELGVGPRPIARRHLSVDSLGEAIRIATTDSQMRSEATDLGKRIRAEDGVARAVAVIERHGRQQGG